MLPRVACHDRACDADIVCVLEQVSRNGCGVGGEDHGSLLVDSLLQVIGEVGRVLYEGLHYNLTAELFKGGLKVACEAERVGVAFLRENVCDGLIAGGLVAVGGGLSASRDAEARTSAKNFFICFSSMFLSVRVFPKQAIFVRKPHILQIVYNIFLH